MSMLAERRQKVKYVINPTKKPLWKTDEGTKFGKQLMEKMGWTAGKGLGINEQGISEPIRVGYKNDTKGMGFKENDNNWIRNQEEYNSLLNSLKKVATESTVEEELSEKREIESLEEKSKKSKARVHYQKFTRGKDLTRYSEDDLASILGNKRRKERPEEKQVDTKSEGMKEKESSFGVTTVNGGSLADYFKRKWKKLEKTIGEDVEETERKSVEKKRNQVEKFSTVQTETKNVCESVEKSKKKRKKEESGDDKTEVRVTKRRRLELKEDEKESENSLPTSPIDSEPETKLKTRKKKRKEKVDPWETTGEEQNFTEDKTGTIQDESSGRKTKKKEKTSELDTVDNSTEPDGNRFKEEDDEDKGKDKGKRMCSKSWSGEKIVNGKKFSQWKLLNLVCDVRLDKFKGSNLETIPGYGVPKPKR